MVNKPSVFELLRFASIQAKNCEPNCNKKKYGINNNFCCGSEVGCVFFFFLFVCLFFVVFFFFFFFFVFVLFLLFSIIFIDQFIYDSLISPKKRII